MSSSFAVFFFYFLFSSFLAHYIHAMICFTDQFSHSHEIKNEMKHLGTFGLDEDKKTYKNVHNPKIDRRQWNIIFKLVFFVNVIAFDHMENYCKQKQKIEWFMSDRERELAAATTTTTLNLCAFDSMPLNWAKVWMCCVDFKSDLCASVVSI